MSDTADSTSKPSGHTPSAIPREARTLMGSAAVIVVCFLVLHVMGAKESTSFLSGTMPGTDNDLAVGAFYVVAHFGFVLVAPILALAGAGIAVAERLRLRRARPDASNPTAG
ncbi:hypothetical protein OAX78_03600 [Planctomycetota bacterium]|nr:hypothetical protein [Planctomycetota bacterium]